uniref:Programmed cell death protein 2 C-terminal domain-containing protein n=1 Tax=Knipowitschia caucasica TaxID=637954 RepID=A0AAV2KTZ9_KNICA
MASSGLHQVLVGFSDGELDTKRHQTTFMTNKVGGLPDVPSLLSRLFPRCSRCGSALVHVVQVYCPLEGSPYHRTLHVFACHAEDCSGRSECWRVLRSQCLEADNARLPTLPQELLLTGTDWCDSADDWGMEEEHGGEETTANATQQAPNETPTGFKVEVPSDDKDMSSQLEKLQLGPSEDIPPCFHPYFISVMEETDLYGEDQDLAHAQKLLKDYEKREGILVDGLDSCEDGGGQEKYEKTQVQHEPPANLSQVIRTCTSCGGPRTFEMQLMPALVSLLQGEGSEIQLEFGTVLVYTCLNSCWTSDAKRFAEEFCFVQSDPDQQLFK